ncbi:MAG: type IX secretion system outer membrane channel protein PorV [Bacteroidales bacterium]|nr:type IX secretion system outer membrane channel protein PorV [Bacteroidales bacterium]
MIKKAILFLFAINLVYISVAQDGDELSEALNPINITVPFLTIASDSRAGAMGDAGVATSPDLSSQHWNPAKYVFMEERMGGAVSYTPWLKNLGVTDLHLLYGTFYYKFDDRQAVSAGLRYFNLGSITFTNYSGGYVRTANPQEWAIDAAYSRLFSEYFSAALAFRFIFSNIADGYNSTGFDYAPGKSYAADLAVYYQRPLTVDKKDAEMALGLNISNIGTKMAYSNSEEKEFIPANLRLGGRFTIDLDEYNSLSFAVDLNKLLVPTPDSADILDSVAAPGVIPGMIQSFYDAPGGGKEELHEIMYSVGVEYWYRNQFAIRAGYFHEHESKGNRKYATLGIGLKLNIFSIDYSYLIPTSGGRNSPLANTMRFTLGFTFE